MLGLVFIITGFSTSGTAPSNVIPDPDPAPIGPGPRGDDPRVLPEPAPPRTSPIVVPPEPFRPVPEPTPASVRRLDILWRDGTGELTPILAQSSLDELAALSVMMASGVDIYAFRVRITPVSCAEPACDQGRSGKVLSLFLPEWTSDLQ